MDFFKKTFDRTKQSVEEKFGDAAITEFAPEFQALLTRADDIKTHADKILSAVQVYIQPDPAIRLVPGLTQEGQNKPETLGAALGAYSQAMGLWSGSVPGGNLGPALKLGDDTFTKLGKFEREYLAAVNEQFLIPVKRFLNEDMKALEQERKVLGTCRLDMDSLKNRVQKAPENSALKGELERMEQTYTDQIAKVEELIKKSENQLPELQKNLKGFCSAQSEYYKKSQKAVDDFVKKL